MIQKLLDQIQSNDVKNINFNLDEDKIILELEDNSSVTFKDVSSFVFTDDHAIEDPHMVPIIYEAGGVDAVILRLDDLDGGLSIPNFSICHKDKSMLIEAGSLEIFGSTYQLNQISH
ncbi:MAG TPA: hypothetical protein VFD08_03925 [Clostridia bacterium]|nr:hypothetical protein [Clostridia bacterium]